MKVLTPGIKMTLHTASNGKKVNVAITCSKKGAQMHSHLADDENPYFWIGAMMTTRTIHSQNLYRNGVDFSNKNVSNGHCKHTYES
jgi:hypothetical protein